MAVVNGTNLVVKFGTLDSEIAVACSTTCTLTLNQAFTEATCKDSTWLSQVEGKKSWEVTVDALYQEDDGTGTGGFIDLSSLLITGPNTTSLVFEEENNPNLTLTNNLWKGTARLTTCALTGDDASSATYSATFTGDGPLTFEPGTST